MSAVDRSPPALARVLEAHRNALASGEGLIKDGRRTAVTRVRIGEVAVCVKEYRCAGRLDRVKQRLRASRGKRAWRSARHLSERGVATPEPLAVIEQGGASHLVTRYVEAARPLDRLLRERFAGLLPAQELAAKRALLRALGRWLRRVHDLGIYHGDWSAKNVLAVDGDAGWEFLLLDTESLAPGRRLTLRRRVKNLGQISDPLFGLTRTDLMRFLAAYAGSELRYARGSFPREVLAWARRRRRRRERRRAREATLSARAASGSA